MVISPLAGKLAEQDILLDIRWLVTAYYTRVPDSDINAQGVEFCTFYDRSEAKETHVQKEKLKRLSSSHIRHKEFGGEEIKLILANARGNNVSIGWVKVTTENDGLQHAHRELKIFIKSMLNYRCNC